MIENENNFESVRRLLALKRHEVPPPGYFNHFSRNVIQRIRAGQPAQSESFFDALNAQTPWLGKVLNLFNAKPVFASSFAGALCVLLFLAVVNGERADLIAQTPLPVSAPTSASLAALSPTALASSANQPGIVSSTNPVLSLQPFASPFAQQPALAQPVSLTSYR
ncbi:MAG TPA: hypothetical protein VMB80_03085 [Candidatus Acidoferrum sp.]|nr:hypothetical protein [Candidatus Acidoferrum sp.]